MATIQDLIKSPEILRTTFDILSNFPIFEKIHQMLIDFNHIIRNFDQNLRNLDEKLLDFDLNIFMILIKTFEYPFVLLTKPLNFCQMYDSLPNLRFWPKPILTKILDFDFNLRFQEKLQNVDQNLSDFYQIPILTK